MWLFNLTEFFKLKCSFTQKVFEKRVIINITITNLLLNCIICSLGSSLVNFRWLIICSLVIWVSHLLWQFLCIKTFFLFRKLFHIGMRLSNHPMSNFFVWHYLMIINLHFSNKMLLLICWFFYRFILFISLNMTKSILKSFFFPLQLLLQVILEWIFHEKSTCNWINCFFVHFFNIFDVRTKSYFVCWFYHTYRWK